MPSGNVISDVADAIRKAVAKREPSPQTGPHRWQTEIIMAMIEVLARDGYGIDGTTIVDSVTKACKESTTVQECDLPENVMSKILEAEIETTGLTPEECFRKWLEYEGIIGYAETIIMMLDGLRRSTLS